MQFAGLLSSATPVYKKYKMSATGYASGLILLRSAANASGQVSTSTTTSFANALGTMLDTPLSVGVPTVYSTTQGDPEGLCTVIINPDQIIRAQMVTGATGTSITNDTIVTASSNGLTFVGGTSVASPDMDEGIVWYTSGSNVGKSRKITSTGATVTGTVIVPFAANAVGDTYCYAGVNIGLKGVTLTTDLQKVRADIATSTGGAAVCVDLELNGTTDSFVHLILSDTVWVNGA